MIETLFIYNIIVTGAIRKAARQRQATATVAATASAKQHAMVQVGCWHFFIYQIGWNHLNSSYWNYLEMKVERCFFKMCIIFYESWMADQHFF